MTKRLSLLLLALGLAASAARADEFIVIRNAKNQTGSLTRADLREMLTGKLKEWPSGKLAQAVLEAEGAPSLKWLSSSVFGVSEVALLTKIKQEVFKGEMKRPVACAGEDECIAQVKAIPGAVAIVSASSALPPGVARVELR